MPKIYVEIEWDKSANYVLTAETVQNALNMFWLDINKFKVRQLGIVENTPVIPFADEIDQEIKDI